ncbi:hypothetical protein RBSWK_04115 [Rhodopirellula baltica SWK14]|uniref:Uncharacterized protein n=1 Tax=Rhodopirellula baltica SWK14 TaxID=993516 RepID=L7CDQ5_RHOBT|nr:hypothetical protein RBSWK_04115 [Rhodopirellula baltica SWK14]
MIGRYDLSRSGVGSDCTWKQQGDPEQFQCRKTAADLLITWEEPPTSFNRFD